VTDAPGACVLKKSALLYIYSGDLKVFVKVGCANLSVDQNYSIVGREAITVDGAGAAQIDGTRIHLGGKFPGAFDADTHARQRCQARC